MFRKLDTKNIQVVVWLEHEPRRFGVLCMSQLCGQTVVFQLWSLGILRGEAGHAQ